MDNLTRIRKFNYVNVYMHDTYVTLFSKRVIVIYPSRNTQFYKPRSRIAAKQKIMDLVGKEEKKREREKLINKVLQIRRTNNKRKRKTCIEDQDKWGFFPR